MDIFIFQLFGHRVVQACIIASDRDICNMMRCISRLSFLPRILYLNSSSILVDSLASTMPLCNYSLANSLTTNMYASVWMERLSLLTGFLNRM